MARAIGVSQPHLHNILKGIRALPPELADQLMALADCTFDTLLGPAQNQRRAEPGGNLSALTLPPDPSMEPRFRGGDVVYYDAATRQRTSINAHSAYLVHHHNCIRVRYLRLGGQRLYLVAEETLQEPVKWDYVSLADRHILEIVRGRIVWICRKVEEAEAGAFEETRGFDRRAG
jgi:hypothetical protein